MLVVDASREEVQVVEVGLGDGQQLDRLPDAAEVRGEDRQEPLRVVADALVDLQADRVRRLRAGLADGVATLACLPE